MNSGIASVLQYILNEFSKGYANVMIKGQTAANINAVTLKAKLNRIPGDLYYKYV